MTVLDIIRAYLQEHGYDGLAGEECGCLLKDLAPCNAMAHDCQPGHRVDNWPCEECGGRAWHMMPGKRPENVWR